MGILKTMNVGSGVHRMTGNVNGLQLSNGTPISLSSFEGVISLGPLSFTTASPGVAYTVYFPYAVTINKIRTVVTTALGATSVGKVLPKNAAGTEMTGVAHNYVELAISAAVGELDSETYSANNTIAADSFMTVTVMKETTSTGAAIVFIEYTIG